MSINIKEVKKQKKNIEKEVKRLISDFNKKNPELHISDIDIKLGFVNDIRKDQKRVVSVGINCEIKML